MEKTCPSCGSSGMSSFYELGGVPVNSVVLLNTRQEALDFPKGDISLAFCHSCGFIANTAFDPQELEYSERYEATQAFSPTFNAFARRLAMRLVEQYGLQDKTVIEIGCGQGEFLTLLCDIGGNRGIGFDPAYVASRGGEEAQDRITFVADFYSERYSGYQGDFVVCKMTLEHIQQTREFVKTVRRSLGERPKTTVFFQVPDAVRILRELAFWDVYYEHCSYFSAFSLAHLFWSCAFDVVNLAVEYDGQYLMIEATPADSPSPDLLHQGEDPSTLAQDVRYFSENVQQRLAEWKALLHELSERGRRGVLWGGGSKAVAFLTTLGVRDEIAYAVDINPYKQGTFLPGTGQEVVAPGLLRELRPDVVIVMNPIYRDEIWQDLKDMGLAPELALLGADG